MNHSRRTFIKMSAVITGMGATASSLPACKRENDKSGAGVSKSMELTFRPYELEMRHPFAISGYSRTHQTVILTEISYKGITGYGEASLPSYMEGQTKETALAFLKKVNLKKFTDPLETDAILDYVDLIDTGNSIPKAGVDIALHDLFGKLIGRPLYRIWGYPGSDTPDTSFTVGIDNKEMIRLKTEEASPYKIIKVKLGKDEASDKMIIDTIRSVTDKPITVDANQGWTDRQYALDMIHWLSEKNVLFVEQPLPGYNLEDMAWLTGNSPLPTIADESCQGPGDIPRLKDVFNGVNIKLIKCGGLRKARMMIALAESFGMQLMIGSTTETSCSVSAAAQLAPRMDYADLDGNLLISNDCYTGMKIVDGKITLNDRPGIGISKI